MKEKLEQNSNSNELFIMIGGNTADNNEEILNVVKDKKIKIYELSDTEMYEIVNKRLEEESKKLLEDKFTNENREKFEKIAIELVEGYLNRTIKKFEEEKITELLVGEKPIEINKNILKNMINLSWKDFNQLISEFVLLGICKEQGRELFFTLNKNQIIKNTVEDLIRSFKMSDVLLMRIFSACENKEDKSKFTGIRKRIENITKILNDCR